MIETLGEALDASWRGHMRCAWGTREGMKSIRECRFGAELDMQTLVCTRGRAFPIARLAERLRCPRCGSRKIAVVFDPPATGGRALAARR